MERVYRRDEQNILMIMVFLFMSLVVFLSRFYLLHFLQSISNLYGFLSVSTGGEEKKTVKVKNESYCKITNKNPAIEMKSNRILSFLCG